MLKVIKKILKKIVLNEIVNKNTMPKEKIFSNLGEEKVIKKYLNTIPLDNRYCVDIGASDGESMSNTLFLYESNWDGIAIEYDSNKFAQLSNLYKKFKNVNLIKIKVTPDNIVNILKSCFAPKNFSFLNVDIDSYDYYVINTLLSEYRPMLILSEINEKIPPPIKFTVKYDFNHIWRADHFYGQSISQLQKVCKKYNYDIVELCYNNAFLIPKEINNNTPLTPEEAYEAGYKNKRDRRIKFPWNSDMEELLYLSPLDGVEFLNNKFGEYKNKYICKID